MMLKLPPISRSRRFIYLASGYIMAAAVLTIAMLAWPPFSTVGVMGGLVARGAVELRLFSRRGEAR